MLDRELARLEKVGRDDPRRLDLDRLGKVLRVGNELRRSFPAADPSARAGARRQTLDEGEEDAMPAGDRQELTPVCRQIL